MPFFFQHYFQIAQHYQAVLQQSAGNTTTATATSQAQQQPQQQAQAIQIVQAPQASTVQVSSNRLPLLNTYRT